VDEVRRSCEDHGPLDMASEAAMELYAGGASACCRSADKTDVLDLAVFCLGGSGGGRRRPGGPRRCSVVDSVSTISIILEVGAATVRSDRAILYATAWACLRKSSVQRTEAALTLVPTPHSPVTHPMLQRTWLCGI